MNQIDFDKNNSNDGWPFRRTFSQFLVGLGAYVAIVLTNISLLIIFAVFVDIQQSFRLERLLYLLPPVIALWIYSAFTTKTIDNSIRFRLPHIFKRFFDVTFSSLCLFLIAPLMILIALIIKLDSHGPMLYRARRIGQYGHLIDIYRFRTRAIAPSDFPLTRVGKVLRRSSLDELPMLYNVLEGELSLVGPWPRTPDMFQRALDTERQIAIFRPGITGLWQISDRQEPDYRNALDLEYIEKWSLLLDFKILLRTVSVVSRNKNH
jgi:lipopolysaccharide/colanic/teichoic acid biosynthesis glycosyltransferase